MFHSIQYLIIVVVQHVKEQMARTDLSGPLHRPLVYGGAFYGVSFVLALFLFFVVPLIYVPFGFTATQSFVMMVVVINLHHFVVDGFIWRTRPAGGQLAVNTRQQNIPLAV
jgi:protein-S-isoprenylcysteine O-methyltransferase Ste14